ncbi:uncharacterized protein LOC123009877 [Tribolium madens]|uniref:uncharacterized protein LOC123009877 n=1 Tax=Tribolium madens TaxID=41895 RepID=UPI001CF75F40|nr:uncharacterized protein LOC123009877 [Tribolium madens]XP_044262363.1 uncharacterized protein LOC123009877 [Tribolium madens]XP_044262365.1 uncharacterized protein LOC123009877 [Tribolium madens]XP_044262366.1 uncharacterized protein LOC123009877 [Tribolium madens]XP_044262367.1 uncharacterized protein LOC123009877 [Tribolium madens]XP_044262368.1 uncharacterized protein LOC123009877 [Tribolium madens]XP_044262369.1 uncharacterized protein LOC123009877 [Tribolium madens]
MDRKKYGVSLSALKSLQDFQCSLIVNKKKRKILTAMPFAVECLLSLNYEELGRCSIVADSGFISSQEFGVIYLKNRVASITETDTTVLFEGKGRFRLFHRMFIQFDSKDDKDAFMTSIQTVLSSSDSDDSGDSVLQ